MKFPARAALPSAGAACKDLHSQGYLPETPMARLSLAELPDD
jgi:hypothetical protein